MQFNYTEFVTDIISSTLFLTKAELCTPTNTKLFPILSQIANNFEQYRFNSLTFHYRSKLSNASNSAITSLGSVMYTFVYDATRPPVTSKMEANNYEGNRSCRADRQMRCPVKCDQVVRYTRPRQLTFNQQIQNTLVGINDVRNECHGIFNLSVEGQANNNTEIGELWVEYECQMFKPKIFMSLGGGATGAKFAFPTNSIASPPNSTNGNWWGNTNRISTYYNTINLLPPAPTTNGGQGTDRFSFDIIEGARYRIELKYNNLGFGNGGNLNLQINPTAAATWQAYPIDYSLDPTVSLPPYTSDTSWILSTTQTLFTGPVLTPPVANNKNMTMTLVMCLKARVTGRVNIIILTSEAAPVGYLFGECEVALLDKDLSFPQGLLFSANQPSSTTSILNPTWVQP